MNTMVVFIASAVTMVMRLVEMLLFRLVEVYDAFLYSPLQTCLWPVVAVVPRTVTLDGRSYTVFTANMVSWARTCLTVPVAVSLKFGWHWTGFWCVIVHDFLDHLDGIVAKVHKSQGYKDDPILGGFMDAFCDKIVNVLSLWSILLVTDFSPMTWTQSAVYVLVCVTVMVYEFILGVVRVQDYFRAYYFRMFKKTDHSSDKTSTAAVMEGKLKEKLESMGLACLCLAQSNGVVMSSVSGVAGIACLFLSIRLAHFSLMSKLRERATQIHGHAHTSSDDEEMKGARTKEGERHKEREDAESQTDTNKDYKIDKYDKLQTVDNHQEKFSFADNHTDKFSSVDNHTDKFSSVDNHTDKHWPANVTTIYQECVPPEVCFNSLHRCVSLNDTSLDTRAERVYTIGCFDLFHHGHVQLLKQMRTLGKKVIVGVHDSRSIYQLKKVVPVDSTVTRMRNVKQYADEVFCVAGTDPTPFIENIFDIRYDRKSTIYVRGDDMPQFPARPLCEQLMTVKFLPYTSGVSSTKLRKDLFNSNFCNAAMRGGYDEMPY